MEGEDEDVLQLLTGEDEFDADIDEDAEEELLREDSASDSNKQHLNSFENQNKSMEDEEEDDDRDSSRRGRFRSERIMSLASVPTRRREIPDNLESIDVNLDNNANKNNYNNRRNNNNNNQQNYRHFKQNPNNTNSSQNQKQNNYRLPFNKSLLPLPNQSMGQPSHPQQQRMVLIPPNIYGQQMSNNSNPMNTIHVNPHFRARLNNQFDHLSHGVRPQENSEPQMRLPMNVMIQQRGQYPTQPLNNSQQMLFNPQINNQFRPHFIQNNSLFNDQNIQQMAPQHQLQHQQQPLLPHPQQSVHHQIQMDTEWRPVSNDSGFQMAPNMMANMSPNMTPNMAPPHMAQQQMIGQQMSQMNRQMNPMLGPTQSNFNTNYDRFGTNYQPNQSLMMSVNGMASYPVANNFGHSFQPLENQRFPVQQNFNKMGFNCQQTVDTNRFKNHPMIPNINVNQNKPMNPMSHQNPSNIQKRVHQPFQAQVRPNRPINTNDQKSEAMKTAQMKTKRAKQLLTKKQSVVKEVRIVKNTNTVPIEYKGQTKENKELEAVVGVDEEYKRKLEEQKRLREEILRKKEERRKAMAAQRLKETESKSNTNSNQKFSEQKPSPVRCQAQQIATLLNRSPQPTNVMSKTVIKRIVKPINEKSISSKPAINRMVVVNSNQNQKRSVLIKGLAASTTEQAIRKLCKPIGDIESCKICVIGGQKTATVTFVRTQDAIQFQSKYERTLLDLSIIQVSLICRRLPQEKVQRIECRLILAINLLENLPYYPEFRDMQAKNE